MPEIFIDFDENDNPVISVKGARGKSCKELTRPIELALGTVTKDELTEEYNQTEVKHVSRILNQR